MPEDDDIGKRKGGYTEKEDKRNLQRMEDKKRKRSGVRWQHKKVDLRFRGRPGMKR